MFKQLLAVLFFIPLLLDAQSLKRLIKYGDKAYGVEDYYTASGYYKQAYDISPIEEATYKWALSEYKKREYNTSLELFVKVADSKLYKYPLSDFYIAMNLKSLGQYQRANKRFQKYYKKHRRKRTYYTLKAKQEIISTEKAFEMSIEPDSIQVWLNDSLSENEYSELLFRSVSEKESYIIAKRPIDAQDSLFTSRLFLINTDTITGLDTNINNPYFQISGFCFLDTRQELLISACAMPNGKKECLIYKSKKTNNTWSPLEPLSENVNMEKSENIHPYFFKNNDKFYLLFSSNSEKGFGAFDMYYSEYKDGQFRKSKNLGRRVNSIDNEISPYYDTLNKKLYFSSEWFHNNGGYDIFFANGDFPNLDMPENMGVPINSNYDDLFYTPAFDYSYAYFSSNRLNGASSESESCCNDIYSYKLSEIKKDSLADSLILVKKVEEMEQLIPIDLFFDNDRPNPKTRDTITNLTYENTYDAYFKQLELYESKFSEGLKKEGTENAVGLIDDFFYNKLEAGFDKLKAFNYQLINLLREGYEVKLTVKGFASPLNSNDYNINLSKRRVSAIVNYYNTVDDALFLEFINGTTEKGRLIIIEEAFGEDTASSIISDDREDARNSIYSPWAAEERRVQLIAFKLNK